MTVESLLVVLVKINGKYIAWGPDQNYPYGYSCDLLPLLPHT